MTLPKSSARAFALVFSIGVMALAGCKPSAPLQRTRAGDAGFVYQTETTGDASVPPAPIAASDAGARPSLALVAGKPGGRGDLDGVGADARIGLVGGMARVGDAIVFADEGNGSIRRFHPATRTVETIARLPNVENGRPALPAYVAYDARADRLFVSDRSRHVVYTLDLASKSVTVLVGRPSVRGEADGPFDAALFDTPTGLAFDGNRTLYVADVGNRSVRAVDVESRTVTTLARDFLQVWGLCLDGGTLFASDNLREALFRVSTKTGETTLVGGSNRFGYAGPTDGKSKIARFREPRGLWCGQGAVYVADRGNSMVRRVDSQLVTTLAGRKDTIAYRDGFATDALFADLQSVLEWDGVLYVGDEATIRAVSLRDSIVTTVAGAPNQLLVESVSRSPLLRPQGAVHVPSERAFFVASCGNWTVQRVDADNGALSTFAGDPAFLGFTDGSGGDVRFSCVSAIATDGRGNLFVGDRGNHAVRAIEIATRRVTTIAGSPSRCGNDDGPIASATFCDPSGLAFADGALFVADASTSTIRRIDLTTRIVSTFAGAPFVRGNADGAAATARFSSPTSIAYVGGALVVADRENHVVRRIDPRTGDVTTIAGAGGEAGRGNGAPRDARFELPNAVVPLASGDFVVIDAHSVRRVSLASSNVVSLFDAGRGLRLGGAAPSLSQPVAAVEIGAGELLLVDRAENALVRARY